MGGGWGYNFSGGGGVKCWTSLKFRFPTIIIFVAFWAGGKNSRDCLEEKYGNSG